MLVFRFATVDVRIQLIELCQLVFDLRLHCFGCKTECASSTILFPDMRIPQSHHVIGGAPWGRGPTRVAGPHIRRAEFAVFGATLFLQIRRDLVRGLCSSLYSLPVPICKMIASSSVKLISCPRICRQKDVLPPLHPNVILCPGLAAAHFGHFGAHDGEDTNAMVARTGSTEANFLFCTNAGVDSWLRDQPLETTFFGVRAVNEFARSRASVLGHLSLGLWPRLQWVQLYLFLCTLRADAPRFVLWMKTDEN